MPQENARIWRSNFTRCYPNEFAGTGHYDDANVIKALSVAVAQWVQDMPGLGRALNVLLAVAAEIRAKSA